MPPFYTQVSVTSSDGGLCSSIQLAKAIYSHKNSVEYKFDNVAALKMNNIAMHYKRFPKSQVIPIEEYTNSIYNSNWEQSEVEGKQLLTPPQHLSVQLFIQKMVTKNGVKMTVANEFVETVCMSKEAFCLSNT